MAAIVSKMATFFSELTRSSESFKVEEFLDSRI